LSLYFVPVWEDTALITKNTEKPVGFSERSVLAFAGVDDHRPVYRFNYTRIP